ncbi:MAG: ABC transporter ATP-binding protein [Clostridia bacterium]|nr:ABC transporter ATP-binding protein [Clostridia bacterium]
MKKNKTENISIAKYLAKYKLPIAAYILVCLLAATFSIAIILTMARAIEAVTIAKTSQEFFAAIQIFIITLICSLSRRICWVLGNVLYYKYSSKIMADLNLDLAKQAFKLNSQTYADYETGTFVQRIVNDPERLVNNLADIVDMITEIISAMVVIVYIISLNIYIGLVLIAVLIACMILEAKRVKTYKINRRKTRKASDKINSLTTEIVRSEKDIKAIGLEEKLSEVSKKYYDDYKDVSYRTNVKDMSFWSTRNFIIETVSILILILGVYLIDTGLLTFAAFMIVYSNNNELYGLIWQLGNIASKFSEIKISSDRMFALFNGVDFVCEKFGNVTLDNIKGKIEFKNVSYCYNDYEKENEEDELADTNKKSKNKKKQHRKIISTNQIFTDLNFKIQPNTTVAFVGKSGSGKSTILNLMSKMFEVDGGEVLIDGVNINDLSKETLRGSISLVNQFPYIFDMTIKENMLLAKPDATNEEIEKAIKDASFDDFITTLKKGVNTKVGESGVKLSGGQKQRLAIARALLRNSSIIIFDESTSSLDNFAQENIKRSIDGLKGKSTVVIVAHRLSTIKNVDKIFFLDEGKIIDSGTFDYLFENNEKFKNMFLAENI